MPQDSVAAGRPSTQGQADISDSLATRAGPSRRHGSVWRQQRPPSPVDGLRITMHARRAPPRGGDFVFQRKVNDQAKASDAGTASASRRLADLGRLRLKLVQICHGALRMRGRGKDEALVVGQRLDPRGEVARVIRARLKLGDDAKIGAEEACAKLVHQLFAGALAAILFKTAVIAVGAMRWCSPRLRFSCERCGV